MGLAGPVVTVVAWVMTIGEALAAATQAVARTVVVVSRMVARAWAAVVA